MSKMREAMKLHLTDPQWEMDETSAISFSAGYQAAIVAIREGGQVGYCAVIPIPNGTYRYSLMEEKPSAIGVAWSFPIYKLPEGLL